MRSIPFPCPSVGTINLNPDFLCQEDALNLLLSFLHISPQPNGWFLLGGGGGWKMKRETWQVVAYILQDFTTPCSILSCPTFGWGGRESQM